MGMIDDSKLASICVLISSLRIELDRLRIYPRIDRYSDAVILALLSKSIVVSEAIVTLIRTGFDEEAFGLTRTLVEIRLILRYISNTNTEQRSRRYGQFFAKDQTTWKRLYEKYYSKVLATHDEWNQIVEMSGEYKSSNSWSGEPSGIKSMAEEPDCHGQYLNGKPLDGMFSYEILYRWMSNYVHVNVSAIGRHITPRREAFCVRASESVKPDVAGMALSQIAFSLHFIVLRAFRGLNTDVPTALEAPIEDALLAARA